MSGKRTNSQPAPHRSRSLFERAGDFLAENGLDPTPAHYELSYRYAGGEDADLVRRIDAEIARHGQLTAAAAAGIIALRETDVSATDVARAADQAQAHLSAVNGVLERSGREARDYGDELERIIAASPPTAVEALISATRAMVDQMRIAEADLRRSGEEMAQLRASLAEAQRTADTDALTGLPNRRALDARLRAAIDNARQDKTPLSLAICDIDHFKTVNDLHGHHIGDEVIKFVAAALNKSERCAAFVARYGGEEFVMLFEGIAPEAAGTEIDRIRAELANRDFKVTSTGRQLGRLTFSAGVAALTGTRGHGAILKSADAALYRAKAEGRNRVCYAG